MSITPDPLTVAQGNSGTVTVSTATLAGAPQSIVLGLVTPPPPRPVGLSFQASTGISPQPGQPAWVGLLPPGISGAFSPVVITSGSSSTLTISVAVGTPIGTYTLEVLATGTGATRSDTFQLVVTVGTAAQDFSV